MTNNEMKKQLKGIIAEVFAQVKTPDGLPVKPPDLDGFKGLTKLKKGLRLTFKEVNELGETKVPVYVIYEDRDGEEQEGAYIVEYQSSNPKKGWTFDDGLGLIHVEAEGMYGPSDEEGRELVNGEYDLHAFFRAAYVRGVYQALSKELPAKKHVEKAIKQRLADEKTRIEADKKAKEMEAHAFAALRDFPLEYIKKELQKAIKLLGPKHVATEIPINVMMLGIAALGRERWNE